MPEKDPTILFDVEGVVTLPEFNNRVIKPLEEQGREVVFWSFASQQRAFDLLKANDLERYTTPPKCYSSEIIELYFILRSKNAINKPQEGMVNYYLSKAGLSITNFQTFLDNFFAWKELSDRCLTNFKYPPLLGHQNALLIESDCSRLEWDKRVERDNRIPQTGWTASSEGAYSLVLVPEHPVLWDVPQPVGPGKVVERLREITQTWTGEHIRIDLGHELGIYQDPLTIFPPRAQE